MSSRRAFFRSAGGLLLAASLFEPERVYSFPWARPSPPRLGVINMKAWLAHGYSAAQAAAAVAAGGLLVIDRCLLFLDEPLKIERGVRVVARNSFFEMPPNGGAFELGADGVAALGTHEFHHNMFSWRLS